MRANWPQLLLIVWLAVGSWVCACSGRVLQPTDALKALSRADETSASHACCAGASSDGVPNAPLHGDSDDERCPHCKLVAATTAIPTSHASVLLDPGSWINLAFAAPLPFESILPAPVPVGVHDDTGPPDRPATALVALHCQLTC